MFSCIAMLDKVKNKPTNTNVDDRTIIEASVEDWTIVEANMEDRIIVEATTGPLITDKVQSLMSQRKLTNAKMSAERAQNYYCKAESRASNAMLYRKHEIGWGEKIAATKAARAALAKWYETAYKRAEDEILEQQIADNNAEINMMPEFMQRKGVKNSYVVVCPMLDWTARRPVVLPLARSRESLSGYMLYWAVAQELKLPSPTCLKMRPQRPWLPQSLRRPSPAARRPTWPRSPRP